jgi:hypothetical protein
MTEFCVRVKKCENLPSKWNNEQVYMELWTSGKLGESRPVAQRTGVANWGEMGEDYPVFNFVTQAGKLVLSFHSQPSSFQTKTYVDVQIKGGRERQEDWCGQVEVERFHFCQQNRPRQYGGQEKRRSTQACGMLPLSLEGGRQGG